MQLHLHSQYTLPCVVRSCHWPIHIVIDFSPRKHGFNPRMFRVGFVVKKVAPRHSPFGPIPSSPVSLIPPGFMLISFCHRRQITLTVEGVLRRHALSRVSGIAHTSPLTSVQSEYPTVIEYFSFPLQRFYLSPF